MNNFYLISNPYRDEGFELRNTVSAYLKSKGASCLTEGTDAKTPAGDTECVVVLGGDGTMLRMVRRFNDMDLKFIGINTGHLGYLTAGDRSSVYEILDSLLDDRFIVEERMMIYANVIREGKRIARHRALNEITVSRLQSLKLIRMNVYLNGTFLTSYAADGLIAATPTGSTAYSFSAGGPIVEPTAKLILLTPLSSHSLNNRSLVFTATDKLTVEIPEEAGKDPESNQYVVYFDGDKQVSLLPGDRVEIAQATTLVRLLKLSERSFVETLRSKMTV